MWFKNIQIYRLPAPWHMTSAVLEQALASQAFTPATSMDLLRQGWDAPRRDGNLVHAVGGQFLLQLKSEKKLLPASVITQVAAARALELEESQGFAPGRKAMKELKERVADELLPRAFSIVSTTNVWIDPLHGWLVVDAASPAKADEVIKHLLKAVDRLPLESLRVQRSPVAVMTEWLQADDAPAGFTVDQDAVLCATGESRAQVAYKRHTLAVDDVRRHIAAGKQCTRLAMTWRDKISFVLDESLAIKSVKALDVLVNRDHGTANDDERFDGDFALMTCELALMLADVVEALGGEATADGAPKDAAPRAAAPAQPHRDSRPKSEIAIGLTAELYENRARHREVLAELYEHTIRPYVTRLHERMAETGEGAIKSAIALGKAQPAGFQSGPMFLVAAVEIMEPSPAAPADAGSVTITYGKETVVLDAAARERIDKALAAPEPDDLYDQAVAIVLAQRRASISLVQRHLHIGYNRAARLLEQMEHEGIVSVMASNGAREVLAQAGAGDVS